MTQTAQPEFGKWRSILWPVHAFELKKLLPMFFMSFFISFNYTILRDTKDTLIVTSCGAGAIPFLKVWGVVPAAILFMMLFTKLSNLLNKENLFYATLAPFLVFFACFALLLYPFREALQLDTFADYLLMTLPAGWGSFIEAIRNWTFSCFYVFSELWGSVALSLLFWGLLTKLQKSTKQNVFIAYLALA